MCRCTIPRETWNLKFNRFLVTAFTNPTKKSILYVLVQLKFSVLSWSPFQPYQKIRKKLHLCAGCDKKETGCTRASAADALDLHQVGNGVHGCDQVGANGPHNRPDFHRWKSEDQWHEVLVTPKLPTVMRHIWEGMFIRHAFGTLAMWPFGKNFTQIVPSRGTPPSGR